jgi:hypothetical protein
LAPASRPRREAVAPAPGPREVEGQPPPSFVAGGIGKEPPDVQADRLATAPSRAGPHVANGNFALLESFTGATLANTNCCQPPDTQMAAGRNEVVEAVNNNIFVYSKGGTQLAAFPATDLFQPSPTISVGLTDPKILFDPTAGSNGLYYLMFMVCEAAGCGANNWTHMGLSLAVTSDPLGSWWVYDYLMDTTTDLQDQEKLGFSADKVTFAVNDYNCKCGSGSNFTTENVMVMQKSDIVAGAGIDFVIRRENTTNGFVFDSMPTTPVNASTGDNTQYVVWNNQLTSNNQMAVIRITGTPEAGNVDFSNITHIPIGDNTALPAFPQPGGNIAGDKENFQSAMVQGNELWAIGTDGCTPQNDNTTRACTRLIEVTLNNNSVAVDTNVGTQGTYRYNPSVMKDTSGHVYFGFTISSASQFPTASLDASALPLPSVLGRIEFGAGDATYTGSRWGDYSGTQQDPANTADVWSAQEFGACVTACSSGSNNWATSLGQFTFRDPHITSVSPTQGPVTGGTTVDIFGSEFANGGTGVTFGGTVSSSVTWLDSTHIRAVSPPHALGTVDIVATTAAGTSDNTVNDNFTYLKIPTTTTYTGPASGDYNDPVTLSARLTTSPGGVGVSGKTLSFTMGAESCSAVTDGSGNASCTITPLDVPGFYAVSVSFAGDATYDPSGTVRQFTVTREESAVSYTGALTQHYHDVFTASATLTDPFGGAPIAGKTITFTLGVGDSCSAVTDGSGNASCSITPHQTGTKNLVASFAGDVYYEPSSQTTSFAITPEETTMTYTGPTVILAGASGATLTATLVEDGANDDDGDPVGVPPDPAETVTLSIGSQSCTDLTDSLGHVSCTIPSVTVGLGSQTVTASFPGDAYYQAASASTTAIVFAFPSTGAFALGDLTVAAATPTTLVTWWVSTWNRLNSLTGGPAPSAFKGLASAVTTLPTQTPANVCSGTWTSAGGSSDRPPATVPSYMGVIVPTAIKKSGDTINGDYVKIVVVRTNPGYTASASGVGTGTIVATFCP